MFKKIAISMAVLAGLTVNGVPARSASQPIGYAFAFGPEQPKAGVIQVAPDTVYTPERTYGFEPGADLKSVRPKKGGQAGYVTGMKPFYFSAALPEGSYRVTVVLGDPDGVSITTVKSELRRLMLQHIETRVGEIVTQTFTVNIRTPKISTGGEVRLKERERSSEARDWDNKLTLEFNDARPCLRSLTISPAVNVTTLYLLGDSTVCDQPAEPWNSWGQMLPRFFKLDVAVANYAESGETLRGALGARRLDKVVSLLKPGDYVFIQFGHNDMKQKGEGVGPFTSYKSELHKFVVATKSKGATPVLVTPVNRKSLDAEGKIVNTLGDYPEAVRQVAREDNTPIIDLNVMSGALYEALGRQNIGKAFQDGTHHNNYGSYEIAKCVISGIRKAGLPLAQLIADDVPVFDPARPDDPERFFMPASPTVSPAKPDGN